MKRQYELVSPQPPSTPARAAGIWQRLVQLYGAADPRSLGVLRIALGLVLFADVALKLPEVPWHFSNTGWLSNHFALFRPMTNYLFSVYFAFGTPNEVRLLMVAHLFVCLLLLVGYRTKLMQILALVLTTSLNSRNILLENGGSVVLNIVLAWTAFLPLGRRFSVDALRASLRARRETTPVALNERSDPARDLTPVVSLAVTALLLQWAIIYFFNALQKNGAPWRDGTAVHYFLQQERLVTWFGASLRGALPLGAIKVLTYGTLLIEAAIPLLLLLPWRPHVLRMIALGLALLLHGSIDCVLQLGSFSWAMLLAFFAFIPSEAWAWAHARWSARRTACVVHYDPESGAFLALCRLIKRLDALGLVTFRPIDELSPKKAKKTLTVSVEGARTEAGFDALVSICDALWFGRRPLKLLSPFVRRRWSRRLAQLATAPEELDADLGLQRVPAEADLREPDATPARLWWRKVTVGLREAGVALLLVVSATQVLLENPAVPAGLKPLARPPVFEAIVTYPRIFQGWAMFAPTPPMDDGRLVIDGKTKDGRPFDPLTGRAPAFEVHPAGAPRQNLIWGYFHIRIADDRFRPYWGGVRELVMRHHKITGRDRDELASFDAYYVSQKFPAPGQPRPQPERRKLFSNTFMPSETSVAPPATPAKGKPATPRAQ
jgi:hypothetical protein